jgi:hypothetical protein
MRRRLERLERSRLLGTIEEANRRLGLALDRLSHHDVALFILAVNEAADKLPDDPDAFCVLGADPEKTAGLSDEAKAGVIAWREAGGAAAFAFSERALGDKPADAELKRAIEEACDRRCRPAHHMARAFPHLRGLL